MLRLIHLLLGAWMALAVASPAVASDAPLFRLFLTDGREVASWGEYARFGDSVIVSMPAGGPPESPRLHVVTLPAVLVDWERTERYAASLRYQRYAATRGEEDFDRLSDEVASVLNEIAFTTDRGRALALAEQARATVAGWPIANFGYRHHDVREIVMVLDEAINALRGTVTDAGTAFELSFVATAPPVALEPMLGLPSLGDQLDQLLYVAAVAPRAADRVALLQSALTLLDESAAALPDLDVRGLRRSIERQIRDEATVDTRYARLADRMLQDAHRAAAAARVSDVERVLDRIPREDARLGHRRPEVVLALQASVQVQLDQARGLRLLRDHWELRRGQAREYQRMAGSQIAALVKTEPWLDAIRRLDGPAPGTLVALRNQLAGGADRLERLLVPDDLRPVHDLFVGAWRLAVNAVDVRYEAVAAADVDAAWAASSAAAGALMLLGRGQQGLAALVEPPTLQDVAP